jgi:hypothetical protein
MEWLRDHGPMPASLAADVIVQVCEALAAAHELGILHRDVKPHNVLMTEDGVCKLTDFGIARIDDNTSMTATGTQIGTFSFMAPEQRSDTKSVDKRADLYSVGASLFTLLTGRTSSELFLADGDDELLAEVPAAFREVILTATRYKPEERYPDARALQAAVLRALARIPPSPADFPPLVRPRDALPAGPPKILPPGRRFLDLERSIALDSNQPTFVPADLREDLDRLLPSGTPRARPAPALPRLDLVQPTPPPPAREPPPPPLTPIPAPTVGMAAGPVTTASIADPRVRWLAYGVGAGGIAVIGMFLVLAVGATQLRSARTECDHAAEALTAALQGEADLGAQLGDQRFSFERAYDAYASASDPHQRVEAALAAVAVIDAAVEQGAPPADARPRVRRLHEVRDDYERAVDTWEALATRFPGSWPVAIGLARHP